MHIDLPRRNGRLLRTYLDLERHSRGVPCVMDEIAQDDLGGVSSLCDAVPGDLQAQITTRDDELQTAEGTLTACDAEIDELRTTLAAREARIDELGTSLAACEALIKELGAEEAGMECRALDILDIPDSIWEEIRSTDSIEPRPPMDIIICAHTELDHIRDFLISLIRNADTAFTLHLVNNGPEEQTSAFLKSITEAGNNCDLIDPQSPR